MKSMSWFGCLYCQLWKYFTNCFSISNADPWTSKCRVGLFRTLEWYLLVQKQCVKSFQTHQNHDKDVDLVFSLLSNCRPPGWLYSPVRIGNGSYKKSLKFRKLPLCSILYFDLMEFSENRDKEFQLGPMLFQTC